MKHISDITLGIALLIGSVLYCILVSTPGQTIDATPLVFTIPIALVFIATDLRKMYGIGKEPVKMSVEIKNVHGHYEAYIGNRFLCSGDTRSECAEAAEELYSDDAA